MTDTIRVAADELKAQLDAKAEEVKSHPAMAEVLRLHQALNALEGVLQEEKTSLSTVFGLEARTLSADANGSVAVRFDEFFGLTALAAAKKYLKKCADARPLPEIFDAVRRGGGKIDSEEELRVGLTRSTMDVVKIGDRFGALEKYSHIKRGGKKKGGTTEAETEKEELQADVDLLAEGAPESGDVDKG